METGTRVKASSAPGPDAADASVWVRATDCFQRWRGGDSAALDDLVRLMTPILWHTVRAYGLHQAAAEDAVQNTWLALVRHGHQVSEPAAIGGWLLTTARRTAWRTRSIDSKTVTVDDVQLTYGLPNTPGAESTAMASISGSLVWQQVSSLDERCQRLLRVIAFDDRPDYAGLANELRMPTGSIGPTRRRCLDKLRSLLERGGHL